MSTEPLKPCPFCGGSHISISDNFAGGMSVRCRCGAKGPPAVFGDAKGRAVASWNRRTPTPDAP